MGTQTGALAPARGNGREPELVAVVGSAENVGPDELDHADRVEAERVDIVRPVFRGAAALGGELEDRQELRGR